MKTIRKTIAFAACLMAAGTAHAQLGGLGSLGSALGIGKNASAGADVSSDVKGFIQRSVLLSEMTSRSLAAINSAFATDTEIEKKRAALAAINQITDPKEKQARYAELYKSESAETQRLLESGEMEQRIGTLDGEKKQQVGNALVNFGIGSLQAVVLTRDGQAIVAKTSANPMDLHKVIPVKDVLPVLAKVASDSGGFVLGVAKLAKGANIEVPAVKADSKPVDVAF